MYQALYRKWRPSTFRDVVGQEHITSILTSEVENGKLSHAYLFCGPRGTGKTTCAKIIAKAANCEHPVNGNPCGECAACRSIEAGTATDIIEMDAASNNGVDDIREIRDGVIYTPADLKYRVYIIDEVHMLSIQAFNALLKTLEEPPEHVIFILATTELHKIPSTVLSRCQRFDFHRVSLQAICKRLETVCKGEQIEVEPEALTLIARLSQGGMRDSLNMLEYCAGDGEKVTLDKAERLLGAASRTLLIQMADAIYQRDTAAALAVIHEIYMSSRDMAVFWREWIAFCRDIMLSISTKQDDEDEAFHETVEKFTLPGILYLLDIFMATESDMQKNPQNARLYAEIALIRACDSTLSTSEDSMLQRIASLEDRLATGSFTAPVQAPIAESKPIVKKTEQTVTEEKEKAQEEPVAPSIQTAPPKKEEPTTSATPSPAKKRRNFKRWQEVVRKISATEKLFAPFLQTAYAYEGADGKFYIYFENPFATKLFTDSLKETVCKMVNAVGSCTYQPYDIIGAVQEDLGGIREPIEDLMDMDEAENVNE